MQPIIILGVAAVAVTLIGTGFLSDGEPWNEFEVWVQQLGWGEADVNSPISHATVDLNVKKIPRDPDGIPDTGDEFFENIISHCSFHSDNDIPAAMQEQVSPGVIICKLTDDRDLAIAEGKLNFDEYTGSDHLFIEITQVAYEGANDVQAPIHDVKLVVEAPV